MRFVRKTDLFLSQPAVYKQYAARKEHASRESNVYDRIAELYRLTAAVTPGDEQVMFPMEPCTYIGEIGTRMKRSPPPAYFVCCYASHPLTEKLNAALYMLKELELAGTQPLSFSDTGWLGPLIALHWADAVQEEVWMVCMEQLSRYRDPALAGEHPYPLAEALALARISPTQGEWRLCCYALEQQIDEEACSGSMEALARRAVHLAEEVMQTAQASAARTIVLPQMLDHCFAACVQRAFTRTFMKQHTVNQGTADLWYTLDELVRAEESVTEALLIFADPLHGVGCVMLRKEETRH